MYKSISFDSSTGNFTLSNASDTVYISGVGRVDYWGYIKNGFDIEGWYPYSDGWKYFKSGGKYYELKAAIPRPYSGSVNVYRYDVSQLLNYS
jgi:hypothetical protein